MDQIKFLTTMISTLNNISVCGEDNLEMLLGAIRATKKQIESLKEEGENG